MEMAKAAVERQFSTASGDFEDEMLDPRVQVELEKLNKASDDINKLELELDEARASFRQSLTESTQKLNALSKKLGSCIEKARPYYEARMRAKEAQIETQNVALRFERACSQLMAAKEMVYLAEQGFFKKGQPFDPAWQEMLNHATIKVNDAEKERLESEVEHQRTACIFNECEQHVKSLQKDLKRNIAKSRPYFEQKARFNQTMEEQKKRVSQLEEDVVEAKKMYSEALRNLEHISDEIHQQRRDAKLRDEMGARGSGVGEEQPAPPPHGEVAGQPASHDHVTHVTVSRTNSETQTETAMLGGEVEKVLDAWLPTSKGIIGATLLTERTSVSDTAAHSSVNNVGVHKNGVDTRQSEQTQNRAQPKYVEEHRPDSITPKVVPQCRSQPPVCDGIKRLPKLHSPNSSPAHVRLGITGSHPTSPRTLNPLGAEERQHLSAEETETLSETISSADVLTPTSGHSSVHTTAVTSPDTENEGDTHVESTRTNMEIMESLQKAKNFKSPFLRPNRSREDLLEEASDNESITGSMASMSVLDDEQIESLMLETSDYVSFLSKHGEVEAEKFKSMTLPAKLSYLQNYMHFRPEFVEALETESNNGVVDDHDETLVAEHDDHVVIRAGKDKVRDEGESQPCEQKLVDEPAESHDLSDPVDIVDSAEFDACWSSEICQVDLPEKLRGKTSSGSGDCLSTTVGPSIDPDKDSEFEQVYRELSAFEKARSFSSSEDSRSPPSEETEDAAEGGVKCVLVPSVTVNEVRPEQDMLVSQGSSGMQTEGSVSAIKGSEAGSDKELFV